MKALITGASSGLGADMARVLVEEGYDVILVARRKTKLEKLAKELGDKASVIIMDVSSTFNCMQLYNMVKKEKIDVLINNAGFGLFGEFADTNIDKELDMIDLNIKGVHTLTKLFLKDFKKRDKGYILNVASSAAFQPGPLMATYYATKAYVLHLTEAIYYELKKEKSHVKISCLCPGPVDTNFNNIAGVKFSVKPLSSEYVAKYAIDKMFDGKLVIVPGVKMKCAKLLGRFLSDKKLMAITYRIQKKKQKNKSI